LFSKQVLKFPEKKFLSPQTAAVHSAAFSPRGLLHLV
jgi:hypothetical protein